MDLVEPFTIILVEVGFYEVSPAHDLRARRLGQGGDLPNHYARNTPEPPEGGDTGCQDAQFLRGCSMALTCFK